MAGGGTYVSAGFTETGTDGFGKRWVAVTGLGTCWAGLAAALIYLNRTGYNGLFRLNKRGGYNVPAGRYPNPRICDERRLRAQPDHRPRHLCGPQLGLSDRPARERLSRHHLRPASLARGDLRRRHPGL